MIDSQPSYNLRVNNFILFLYSLSYSVIGVVDANFLFELTKSTFVLGLSEGLYGIAQLVTSIISGKLADKYGELDLQIRLQVRIKHLKINSWMGIIVSILWLFPVFLIFLRKYYPEWSLTYPNHLPLGLYMGISVLNGAQSGFGNTLDDVFFADLVPSGDERTRTTSNRYIISYAASTLGPIISIMMFYFLGDEWKLDILSLVLLVGIVLTVIYEVSFQLYKTIDNTTPLLDDSPLLDSDDLEPGFLKPKLNPSPNPTEIPTVSSNTSLNAKPPEKILIWWIPYIVQSCEITFALSAGMLVKYWGIFFEEIVKFSPIQYGLTTLCRTLLLIVFTKGIDFLQRKFKINQIITSLVTLVLGLAIYSCLLYHPWWTNKLLMAILFVIRSAFMNCSAGPLNALMMDNVSEKKRGFWTAVGSISTFSWCGTAMFGGAIIQRYGFNSIFIATGCLQLCAIIVLLPLLKLVNKGDV